MSYASKLIISLVTLLMAVYPAFSLSLEEFRTCVGTSGQLPICTLNAGAYGISPHIAVQRSGIIVEGTLGLGKETTLYKGARFEPIMMIESGVTNVTVRHLIFDGQRSQFNPDSEHYGLADLELEGNNSAITIDDVEMRYAPFYSVRLATSYTLIKDSVFTSAVFSPVRGDPQKSNYTITNCTFQANGGSGISIFSDSGTIYANWFIGNHAEFPHDSPGGQVHIDGNGATITSNYLNGQAIWDESEYWEIAGFELYGGGHVIRGNHVLQHSGPGYSFDGVYNSSLDDSEDICYIQDNNRMYTEQDEYNGHPGIIVKNHERSTTSNVTIAGVRIVGAHERPIISTKYGQNPVFTLSVVGGCWNDSFQPEPLAKNGTTIVLSPPGQRPACW